MAGDILNGLTIHLAAQHKERGHHFDDLPGIIIRHKCARGLPCQVKRRLDPGFIVNLRPDGFPHDGNIVSTAGPRVPITSPSFRCHAAKVGHRTKSWADPLPDPSPRACPRINLHQVRRATSRHPRNHVAGFMQRCPAEFDKWWLGWFHSPYGVIRLGQPAHPERFAPLRFQVDGDVPFASIGQALLRRFI